MSDYQILEARVAAITGEHAVVQALPPGGGEPIVMRVKSREGFVAGATVHVKARLKINHLAEDVGAPGDFGELTPPPRDEEATPAPAPAVAATGQVTPEANRPRVPAMPDNYVPDPTLVAYGGYLDAMSRSGVYVRAKITGPTGIGKTTFAQAFAAEKKRPYHLIECGLIQTAEDFFGQMRMNAEGTYFEPAPALAAFETPNCVVVLDEATRVGHPKAFNGMMGLLSDLREAFVPGLDRVVRVAPGVIVMATMNEGAEYTGTSIQDRALTNRLSFPIRLNYMPQAQEIELLTARCSLPKETAKSLVVFANKLRDLVPASLPFAPSTRNLIDIANLIGYGGCPAAEAVERVIEPEYMSLDDEDNALTKVRSALQGLFSKGSDPAVAPAQYGNAA